MADDIDSDIEASLNAPASTAQAPQNPVDADIESHLAERGAPQVFEASAMADTSEEQAAIRKQLTKGAKESWDFFPGVKEGLKDAAYSVARPLAKFADYAGGGPGANFISNSVNQEIESRNNQLAERYGDNGWFSGGRLTGGIAGAAPAFAAGGEVAAPLMEGGGAASTLARFATGRSTNPFAWAPSKMISGAGQGAEAGALNSASSNQDPVQQIVNDAKAGAALSPALAVAGGAASNIGGYIKNKFAQAGDPAAFALAKNLKADGFNSISDAQAALDKLGPDATWADLGPNTRDFTASLARQQGQPKQQIQDFVEGRQMGDPTANLPSQSQRLIDALKEHLGVDTDYDTMKTQLTKQQADESDPLYKQAFSANQSVQSPVIDKILDTDFGKSALSGARDRMNTKMANMGVADPELTEQANDAGLRIQGGVASGLKLQTLDLAKQDMDDQIGQAIKKVARGDMSKGALGDMMSMRSKFVNELDANDVTAKAGPNSTKPDGGLYAQARSTWGGHQRQLNALDTGREFMSTGASDNEDLLDKMNPAERQAASVGAVKGLQDAAANTPNSADIATKMFKTPEKQARFQGMFDNQDDFSQFKQKVNNEQELHKFYNEVKGNSATARRSAVDENPIPSTVGTISDIATGNHGNLFARGLDWLDRSGKLNAAQTGEATNLMLGPTKQASARLEKLGSAGVNSKESYLPGYVKMLSSMYGVPSTIMGINSMNPFVKASQ